jgi:hypothetical protein
MKSTKDVDENEIKASFKLSVESMFENCLFSSGK